MRQLVGRVLDLRHAYKQVPLVEGSWKHAGLMVYDPASASTKFFVQLVLPFGAKTSVREFVKVGRAIWFAGMRKMNLMWGTYVDDYPTIEFEITAEQGLRTKHLFLEVLGWQYANDPSKCKAYAVPRPECVPRREGRVWERPGESGEDLGGDRGGQEGVSRQGGLGQAEGKIAVYLSVRNGRWPEEGSFGAWQGHAAEGTDKEQALSVVKRWLEAAVPRGLGCDSLEPVRVYTD
eukprot:2678560-Amphidinium_carterae.1